MPKRNIQYYERKIEKLRAKTKKRRRMVLSSSSDSEENEDNGTVNEDISVPIPNIVTEIESIQTASNEDVSNETQLDPDVLSALGDAVEETPVYGQNIHNSLAERWMPILRKGLLEDTKTKLFKEYPIPANCKLLKAPTLNSEISAAVAEVVRNRDKSILMKQDQLGYGITAVNRGISLLLSGDDKIQAIKVLSDGCRILTDLHSLETKLRVKLITPCLDKSFLFIIEKEDRDETLFGVSLPEKMKASKAIEKQGHQIKKTIGTKLSASTSVPSTSRGRYQENWTGPPRYPSSIRGGRGGLQQSSRMQYRRTATNLKPIQSRRAPSNNRPAPRQ
ncbi:uncharacterized protein LOC131853088 [Achroia grisella]|uniref:uncharacterized protein LOC131853088 n=1 Tax=Achroia grisella TaxID=688607 RepID=UPI0027D32347|nr:uncharacterized protein LOC131853088 [Achroia grisella]